MSAEKASAVDIERRLAIERYTPSYLPHTIVVNRDVIELVSTSWARALSGQCDGFREVEAEFIARGESYRSQPDIAFHTVFYGRLFELIPEVKAKFRAGGMQDQGNLFTRMFDFAVREFSTKGADLRNFDEVLGALARFHNQLGVIPYDYAAMGLSLFSTIHRFLGSEWTQDVELCWLHFYGRMMQAVIPEVVTGGTLDRDARINFVRQLSAFADPDPALASKDLREWKPSLLTGTPTASRLTTLGRGYIMEDSKQALSRLPRTDEPQNIKKRCSCGQEFSIAVPITAITQGKVQKNDNKNKHMGALPAASHRGIAPEPKAGAAAPKPKKGRFAPLQLDAESALEKEIPAVDALTTPKASEAGAVAGTAATTKVDVHCPNCGSVVQFLASVKWQ